METEMETEVEMDVLCVCVHLGWEDGRSRAGGRGGVADHAYFRSCTISWSWS